MAATKLTEKIVTNLPAPTDAAQAYHWDDEVTGLGVVVGRTGAKTFVLRGRVGDTGERVKVTIGRHRAARPGGGAWTLDAARTEAKRLIGALASGRNPNDRTAPGTSRAGGPTLRDGMEAHLARMRKKQRADRSIATFENEVTKYFAAWLDRPIGELTGSVLVELHEQIKKNAAARAGTNPRNDKGAPLANRVVTHISACWNSLNKKLEGKLGSWNPAKAVDKDVLKPKRERLDDLAAWAVEVATMRNPVQRDGLMLALFTGLRSEDVRTIHLSCVDWDARTLELPDPKGGEAAAFKIPLSPTAFEILDRRRRDNKASPLLSPKGGDQGWAFPTISNDGEVIAIGDLRQKHAEGDQYSRVPRADVHTLRRTYLSIAEEEGVSELDQHVLTNHTFGSRNVNATYISQHIDHLADVAAKIDAGITRRLKPDGDAPGSSNPSAKPSKKRPAKRGGAHLRAV